MAQYIGRGTQTGTFDKRLAALQQEVAAKNIASQLAAQEAAAVRRASSQISAQQASAKRANLQRYAQIMAIYDKIIARAGPGGAFEKAGLGEIEKAKTKGVGQETQQMISSGMYGTTTAAGIGRGWEADVGAPARLRLEDIMEQRLSTAQLGKAGAIERREDVYPDYNALLQMLAR